MELDSDTLLLHHIAKPPCDRDFLSADKQRETYWLTKHCHGLEWDQGDIQYYPLIDKLRTCLINRPIIYVKGLKKKQYVEKYLMINVKSVASTVRVIDMSDIGCLSLGKVPTDARVKSNQLRCGRHKTPRHKCALANCTLLKAWFKLHDYDVPY